MGKLQQVIVSILRADHPKRYTAGELLKQVVNRHGWTTKSKTPERTFDARLADLTRGVAYPVEKEQSDRGTVFFYSPEKALKIEDSLVERTPLEVDPIQLVVAPKEPVSGRIDVDDLTRILSAVQDAIKAFGRLNRGTGGQSPSDYRIEVVAAPFAGSFGVALAPVALEGVAAAEATINAIRSRQHSAFSKQLKKIHALENRIGPGRAIDHFELKWRGESVRVGADWFAQPDLEEEATPFWVELVTPEAFILVGEIEEIDSTEKTFRLGTSISKKTLEIGGEATFDNGIDRNRWREVAVLCCPSNSLDGKAIDLVRGSDFDMWTNQDFRNLRGSVERFRPPDDDWLRVLKIMHWAAVCQRGKIPIPHPTPELDENGKLTQGLGFWFQNPVSRRELDLDCFSDFQANAPSWHWIKTHSSVGAKAGDPSAIEEGELAEIGDLVDLAKWISGVLA